MAAIKQIEFHGEPALELRARGVRLVATTSRGPRLAFLGREGGDNLLYWAPGRHRHGKWDLLGGHRVWLTRPGADEAEETYSPDNGACAVRILRDGCELTQPEDKAARTVRRLTVRMAAGGRLVIEQGVTNTGNMLWSGGLWGLTCTQPTPTTTYVIPLSDGSAWDTAGMTFFKAWGGSHTGSYDDPQFRQASDAVHVRALGTENKRAFRAAPGIIALHDPRRDVLFAKRAEWQRGAVYPLDSNLAVYTGANSCLVEMETMSPVATLKPGESLVHTETWLLRAAPPAVPSAAALRTLCR